jgi:hypothetical protein
MKRKYRKYLYKQLEDTNRMQTDYLDKQDFVKIFLSEYRFFGNLNQVLTPLPSISFESSPYSITLHF